MTGPRPVPPVPDPRSQAKYHAARAHELMGLLEGTRFPAADAPWAAFRALGVIAHALTSLALTELHPPRRFPFPAPKGRRCDCVACDASGVDAADYADPMGGVE